MIRLNNRMMFPEPEDVGGGSTEVSTYSLDSAPDEEEEAVQEAPGTPDVEGAADTPEQAPPPQEYTLTFEEADNINADYQAVLTAAAKETEGLDAALASRLFHNLTQHLNAESQRVFQQDDAALKSEWGRDFEPRLKSTLAFMKRTLNAAGCTPEENALFENPRGLRVMNKLMAVFSEGKAVGTGAGKADAPAMSKDDFIRAKTKEIIAERNKPEPNQERLRELRHEINEAVGLNI